MATSKSFAYNSGSPIAGTNQVGDLAISLDQLDYTTSPGGVQWWQGPDEDLGYVIAHTVPNDTQPTPVADYLYLDPTRLGDSSGLSNSNQTVQQQFGYIQSTLGTKLIGANDQVMFSVLVSLTEPATLAHSHYIGIGTANMNYNGVTPDPYSAYPGNDDQSMGYRSDGTIWYNGSQYAAGLQTWGDDDVIDIVINNNVTGMWVRVNGGYWNNNATHNPETNVGSIELINAPFYPVLCPGYQGTMTIQNSAAYGTPRNCKLFGDETAAVGFNRSTSLTEASFIEVANSVSGQDFASGNAASTWLTDNGYWNNWSSFGSSGFQWMTMTSITDASAAGIGQNNVTVAITQSKGGMQIEGSGMYSANTFPEEYGVPIDGIQIRNTSDGVFTAIFSQPVTDPLVAFASVGNPGLPVPVQVSATFTPIWETATTYQNASGPTQYTQFTGQEGFNIIRIDGTISMVTFNYTVSEYYCTVCFGFVDQNA